MRIKLTPEQEKKYVLSRDIISILNKHKGDEMLDLLEGYLVNMLEETAELFSRELLLGHISVPSPTEWDDWTDEEKLILFDRQDINQKIVTLSQEKMTAVEEEEKSLNELYPVGEGVIN